MENEKHKAMAEKEYPEIDMPAGVKCDENYLVNIQRDAFIAGLNKNEGLVDALDDLVIAVNRLYPHCHEANMKGESDYEAAWLQTENALKIATEALTQYNSGEEK